MPSLFENFFLKELILKPRMYLASSFPVAFTNSVNFTWFHLKILVSALYFYNLFDIGLYMPIFLGRCDFHHKKTKSNQ